MIGAQTGMHTKNSSKETMSEQRKTESIGVSKDEGLGV